MQGGIFANTCTKRVVRSSRITSTGNRGLLTHDMIDCKALIFDSNLYSAGHNFCVVALWSFKFLDSDCKHRNPEDSRCQTFFSDLVPAACSTSAILLSPWMARQVSDVLRTAWNESRFDCHAHVHAVFSNYCQLIFVAFSATHLKDSWPKIVKIILQ